MLIVIMTVLDWSIQSLAVVSFCHRARSSRTCPQLLVQFSDNFFIFFSYFHFENNVSKFLIIDVVSEITWEEAVNGTIA